MKTASRVPLGPLLLVLALGVLAYANTFHAPFELDDLESIVDNPIIRHLANFAPGGEGFSYHPRRWVGYLTFALNYELGGLSLPGFHAFNLAVHLGTAFLVYALVRLTFRTPQLAPSRLAPRAGTVALLAALFFVAHPVQTQAVTYVTQRLTSLATFFYLLSLALYATGRLRQEAEPGSAGSALFLVGAALPAVAALQTKEIALTLPLAAALYEALFFRGPWKPRALWLLPLLLTLPLLPCQILLGAGASGAGEMARAAGRALAAPPWTHYVLTEVPVVATYLRLLVLPVAQNIDYDYPVYTTPLATPVVLSFLVIASLLAGGVFAYRRASAPNGAVAPLSRDPALRVVAFCCFWFFLTLSVESVLVPLADVIFEHRLYLPSVGACAAVSVGWVLLSEATRNRLGGRLPLAVAGLALAALTAATIHRNSVWGSNLRLWDDTARKSPGKARPWYNLGTYLGDAGRPADAVPALNRALSLDPKDADAWHNLGRAYLLLGRPQEALAPLREAVRLRPELDKAAVNLAVALLQTHRPAEAVPLLERIRSKSPELAVPRFNLALAYLGVGDLAAARGELAYLQRGAPQLAPALAAEVRRAEGLGPER